MLSLNALLVYFESQAVEGRSYRLSSITDLKIIHKKIIDQLEILEKVEGEKKVSNI